MVIAEHEAINKNFDLTLLFKTDDGSKKPKPKGSSKNLKGLESLEGSIDGDPN